MIIQADPTMSTIKTPLYLQVAQTLKQRVRTGAYEPGQPLPSVRALGEEFGVSLTVIQKAVRKLEEARIVVTRPGRGMTVEDADSCSRTALVFGVIHPYLVSMSFRREVLEHVDEAFAERSNFSVMRSSRDDPALERQFAAHLIENGVKGLLIWPTSDDPNGPFFADLARQTPVVLIDRLMAGAELPAVIHDYEDGGRALCRRILDQMSRRRLLVLMDDLRISAYELLTAGIHSEAARLGRLADVTIVQLPITRVIHNINQSDFSGVDFYEPYVERLIREGGYDTVFSTQDEFLEYVIVETGLVDRFPEMQLATMRGIGPNMRCRRYRQAGVLDLVCDSTAMVARAADLLQRWVLERQPAGQVIRLKPELAYSRLER